LLLTPMATRGPWCAWALAWVAVVCSFTMAATESCGPAPNAPDGKSLGDHIKDDNALLIAIPDMRCTNAIASELSSQGIPYKTIPLSGEFGYEHGKSPAWDWLHCSFPNDATSDGTVMHSYFFFKGTFVGNGFSAQSKVAAHPDQYKSELTTLMAEQPWSENIVKDDEVPGDLSEMPTGPWLAQVGTSNEDCTGMDSINAFVNQYDAIFKTGNRNAASHLWSTYLFQRSKCVSSKQFETLSKAYCAISGSPVQPTEETCYASQHKSVASGTMVSGQERHCCPPCYCDAQDWVAIDTKTVTFKDGASAALSFMVIGNPCATNQNPFTEDLKKSAPELACDGNHLKGATLSDNNHVIIGMYFTGSNASEECMYSSGPMKAELTQMCQQRHANPTQGGMGEIFINLAKINPVLSS